MSDELLRAAFYERRLAELRARGMHQVEAVRGELTSLEAFGEAGFVAAIEDKRRKRFVLAELSADQVKSFEVGQTVRVSSRGEQPHISKSRELERDHDRGFER